MVLRSLQQQHHARPIVVSAEGAAAASQVGTTLQATARLAAVLACDYMQMLPSTNMDSSQ